MLYEPQRFISGSLYSSLLFCSTDLAVIPRTYWDEILGPIRLTSYRVYLDHFAIFHGQQESGVF